MIAPRAEAPGRLGSSVTPQEAFVYLRALAVCRVQPGVTDVRVRHERICFTADDSAVAELSQALVEAGALIRALTPQTATLEDLFFSLTEGVDGDAAVSAEPEPLEAASP